MDEKKVRIISNSVSRLVNGTGESRQPGVAEIHAGIEPKDVEALQAGTAQLVAAIIENGKKGISPPVRRDDKPIPPRDDGFNIGKLFRPFGGDNKPDHHIPHIGKGIGKDTHISDHLPPINGDDYVESDSIPFGGISGEHRPYNEPIGTESNVPENGYDSTRNQEDDDERRTILGVPIPIKILGIGATLGLSFLLSQCKGLNAPGIGNPFIDVHEEHHIQQSNVHQIAEIADLYFESDEYLRGSQVRSPGELIDSLRNASWAEELGRVEGREEYDSMGDDSRVAQERRIQEINKLYDEQTQIIQDNKAIIEDSSSSPKEKEEAIKTIQKAKVSQKALYDEFSPLFESYFERAVSDVQSPADDRTDSEIEEYSGIYAQYQDSQINLARDADKISGIVETYLNPERYESLFFEETPEQAFNAKDKGTVVNTLESMGPFGHREVVESEVASQLDANPNDAGQVHEGLIDVTQAREVTVTETRIGISAVFHKIGDFFSELGKNITERFNSFIGKNEDKEQPKINNDQEISSPSSNRDFEDEER